jgi:hypothetical protein
MLKYSHDFALAWCQENGWTDFFTEQYRYWAFPPGAVMPLPLPAQALQLVTYERILSPRERLLYGLAVLGSAAAAMLSYWQHSPLPLTFAFVFCAVIFALLEEDEP